MCSIIVIKVIRTLNSEINIKSLGVCRLSLMTANKNEEEYFGKTRLSRCKQMVLCGERAGRESRAAAGITINTFKCGLFHAMTGISRSIHTQFSSRIFGDHHFFAHIILERYWNLKCIIIHHICIWRSKHPSTSFSQHLLFLIFNYMSY